MILGIEYGQESVETWFKWQPSKFSPQSPWDNPSISLFETGSLVM